jgi:hypothetical protein
MAKQQQQIKTCKFKGKDKEIMNYLTASHSTTTTTLDTVPAAGDAYLPPLSKKSQYYQLRLQKKQNNVFHIKYKLK